MLLLLNAFLKLKRRLACLAFSSYSVQTSKKRIGWPYSIPIIVLQGYETRSASQGSGSQVRRASVKVACLVWLCVLLQLACVFPAWLCLSIPCFQFWYGWLSVPCLKRVRFLAFLKGSHKQTGLPSRATSLKKLVFLAFQFKSYSLRELPVQVQVKVLQ